MKALNKMEFLLHQIETKRNEMVLSAVKTGLSSEQTLCKSRELDDLLNLHQKISTNKEAISSRAL